MKTLRIDPTQDVELTDEELFDSIRFITLETAGLGATPEFWLRAQENYDLFQARKKVDTRSIRVSWKSAVAAL